MINGWSTRKASEGRAGNNRTAPLLSDDNQAFTKLAEEDLSSTNGSSPSSHLLASEQNRSTEFLREMPDGVIEGVLSIRETAKLSFQFSLLWVDACSIRHRKRTLTP